MCFLLLQKFEKPECMIMMSKKPCQEFKVGPILTHIEHVFNFRTFSLLLHMFEKSESMNMMSKEPFTKIVKLIDPRSEFQALGCDQYEHILKMYNFLKWFFLLLYI